MPEKCLRVIFICRNLFVRIAGKIAKIRARKNFVPHGNPKKAKNLQVLLDLTLLYHNGHNYHIALLN